jgi:hypothetical protein
MARSEKEKDETYVPGNIISFEQKRRELAERRAEEESEKEYYENAPITTLSCACGSVGLTVYTDGQYMMAECTECGMPMLTSLIMFLRGDS